MNRQQAKEILMLYRPGDADANDPQLAEALALARRDPELGSWLAEHQALQSVICRKFQQVPVPEELSAQILAEHKTHRPIIWWRQPSVLAAAAAIALLISLAVFWSQPREAKNLSGFLNRMVSFALRSYAMNLETNDLKLIRTFLVEQRAHGDYALPKPLEKTTATGCVITSWQGKRVSMLCFNSGRPLDPGEKSDLFLFVIDRIAMPDAPLTNTPTLAKVNRLITASWSRDDKIYVLASPGDEGFIRKFL